MTEAPTKEGQNIIIKNLNNIFVALSITAVGALFNWGNTLSHNITEQKDLYDQTIVGLHAQIDALQNELNDAETDIKDLQEHTESMHDDTKVRLTHLEDWQLFHNQK